MTYGTVHSHQQMFYDSRRNGLYEAALKETVTPDSVVLDLGAGLGILGYLAARCGARKVYLLEPSRILTVTREIMEASAFSDRIEYVQATAEEAVLPEPVDIIISVFTGNFLVSEDLLPSLFFARERFLKPGGRLLPDGASMMIAAVSTEAFYNEQVDQWQTPMAELNVSSLRRFAANSIYSAPAEVIKPNLLSGATTLRKLDFNTAVDANCDHRTVLEAQADGTCHGVLGWFSATLGSASLGTGPEDPPMHWSQVFMPLTTPLNLRQGDQLEFRLQRPDFGEWTWTVEHNGHSQRQSTFLSEPRLPGDLLRRSNGYSPSLTDKGRMLQWTLGMMDGGHPNSEIIEKLMSQHPDRFHSVNAARDYVVALAERYG